ncbi:MAG: T9SS type A sorting domain-containing protein [Melioribacteraceae bacterium]|nr:T9SS type A sorting domain-containing protein [Melioribacteraceae bacterium]MCF8414417.1 T9SS type A sorting domain-containing protein [Melioribacteraceae bacterium]
MVNLQAGSISGNVSYSGNSTGTIIVAAFTSYSFQTDPTSVVTLDGPGEYRLNDLADGKYYILSLLAKDLNFIKATDPFGFYGLSEKPDSILVQNNDVKNINFVLYDCTVENPNPFAQEWKEPDLRISLPNSTMNGRDPSLAYDGTYLYLCKHDSINSSGEKIYKINPETGNVAETIFLNLESSLNRICWIDQLIFMNGQFWIKGGFGTLPQVGTPGIFKADLYSGTSSPQMVFPDSVYRSVKMTTDGENIFLSMDSSGTTKIVKFNPNSTLTIPSIPFINLDNRVRQMTYGDGYLWVGIDKINKFDPTTGDFLGSIDLPGFAAEIYFDNKFWCYNEESNSILVYNANVTGLEEVVFPTTLTLSQNYPNPFNPITTIRYTIPKNLEKTHVILKIFDILGREVQNLVSEKQSGGEYEVLFNANGLPSGIYLYRLYAGDFTETKKLILLK